MESLNDLEGQISLLKENGRITPIFNSYKGHACIKGQERQDSYKIHLKDKDQLFPGETCEAEFSFLFSYHEKFEIKIQENQILELNEGIRKIGEFRVTRVLNEKLKIR